MDTSFINLPIDLIEMIALQSYPAFCILYKKYLFLREAMKNIKYCNKIIEHFWEKRETQRDILTYTTEYIRNGVLDDPLNNFPNPKIKPIYAKKVEYLFYNVPYVIYTARFIKGKQHGEEIKYKLMNEYTNKLRVLKKEITNFINGSKEGISMIVYPDETPQTITMYKDNKKHGLETEWFGYHEKIIRFTTWRNNKKNGKMYMFHMNGKLMRECTYKDDCLNGYENVWDYKGELVRQTFWNSNKVTYNEFIETNT